MQHKITVCNRNSNIVWFSFSPPPPPPPPLTHMHKPYYKRYEIRKIDLMIKQRHCNALDTSSLCIIVTKVEYIFKQKNWKLVTKWTQIYLYYFSHTSGNKSHIMPPTYGISCLKSNNPKVHLRQSHHGTVKQERIGMSKLKMNQGSVYPVAVRKTCVNLQS